MPASGQITTIKVDNCIGNASTQPPANKPIPTLLPDPVNSTYWKG